MIAIHNTCCLLAIGVLIRVAAGCASPESAQPPLVRLVATDFAFDTPSEVEAGLTRLRLVNQGQAWHYALVSALPDGATVDTYIAGVRAGEEFPASAVDVGGPGLVASGDSSEVVLNLRPGQYALLCWYDNHLMAGMSASLTVREKHGVAAVPEPVADVTVVMQDFAFEISRPFRAGHNTIHVTNTGTRPHEFDVYRIKKGQTRADFEAWQTTRQGSPPAVPVGGVGDFVPGREVWVSIPLRPGRYLMICEVPEGEQTHADMGMLAEFEVR